MSDQDAEGRARERWRVAHRTHAVLDGGPRDGDAVVVSTGPDGHPRMEYLSVPVDDAAAVPERARYRASPDAPAPGDPWRYEYDGRAW